MSQDIDEIREVVGQLNGPPTSESVTKSRPVTGAYYFAPSQDALNDLAGPE